MVVMVVIPAASVFRRRRFSGDGGCGCPAAEVVVRRWRWLAGGGGGWPAAVVIRRRWL
ncbi:hypothetical protein AtEden1_Chr2g0244841 [Arabidopsis thaliana]